MNTNDYILKDITALRLNDSVKNAQNLFKNFPITHFPVVENDILLGSFAEDDAQTIENKEDVLENYSYLFNSFFAEEKATVLELIKIFADNNASIVPVLNADKNYIGYYDLNDVLEVFSSSPFMLEQSETLVVEKLENDYSMSEVTQIVETNGGKILGIYISDRKDGSVQITLKVVSNELNEMMHTFRRYNYEIISTHENDMYLEDLKNRSEYLQKYLEM
ncbi:CBS domain-containing protein [Polaribacter glomeratus]|uniref:Acetoin utilization protein acuB n=1 Tax=Polaribacter glomeratus TaxID=102 RepID=A0A2S7WI16_9FLAO|nr:CBS domain-containing protein [Polaribacter glomeratus]PQJ77248.1 acetoin utilization protein acuB [Polaribacter glomeratus]TXD65104.1 CBS domain-containing protein [Polaribacter glomeratus]